MKVEDKIKQVEGLKTNLSDIKGFWFTDFTGLPVETMREMRKNLRLNSLSYRVIKKSILSHLLEKLEIPISDEWMEGAVGVCMGSDLAVGSRLLTNLQKKETKFKLKGCWFEGRSFSLDEVKEIATLPGREVLVAQLLANLSSPFSGLIQVLQALLMNLSQVLVQIKDSKEKEERS